MKYKIVDIDVPGFSTSWTIWALQGASYVRTGLYFSSFEAALAKVHELETKYG